MSFIKYAYRVVSKPIRSQVNRYNRVANTAESLLGSFGRAGEGILNGVAGIGNNFNMILILGGAALAAYAFSQIRR